jgi:hypothetical protein
MGMFDWIGDVAKTVVYGVEDAAEWVGERVHDVEQWFGDLFSGDLGAQAMSLPEVMEKVTASRGATDWHSSAGTATALASGHRAVAARIQAISSGLESVWTGSGAEAAQAKLKPLSEVADSAAQTFNTNSTNVTSIASGFDEMKRTLTPLPSSPPHKDFWDVVTPWNTDTEEQVNKYNAQVQENLNRYNAYAQHAQETSRQLAIDYGQIGTFDGNIILATDSKTGATTRFAPNSSVTADASHLDAPLPTTLRTGGLGPATTEGSGVVSNSEPTPGSLPSDGTTSSAYVPSGQLPTGPGPSSSFVRGGSGLSPMAHGLTIFAGPGMGAADGSAETGGGARSGSLGRGGGTEGRGAGEDGQPGTGRRTGIGPRSAPGAAAAERAVVTGRGSGGGLGAAGTGTGRGKNEDDKEHSRKYGIEDDSLFADRGDRPVDPETGMRVTPPTIG